VVGVKCVVVGVVVIVVGFEVFFVVLLFCLEVL